MSSDKYLRVLYTIYCLLYLIAVLLNAFGIVDVTMPHPPFDSI